MNEDAIKVGGLERSVHAFMNPGTEPARDVAAAVPDKAKLMDVMKRYGLVPASPRVA